MDNDRCTALMLAAQYSFDKCFDMLIKVQTDVNKQTKRGETTLMKAAVEGHWICPVVIIHAGPDVNKQYKHKIPLMKLPEKRYNKCVDLMIQTGGDVNKCDKDGCTAVIFVARE